MNNARIDLPSPLRVVFTCSLFIVHCSFSPLSTQSEGEGEREETYTMSNNQGPKSSPGRRLRDALAAGPIQVPGVFNALVARMAERLGFRAVYLSGAALSAAAGVPD